MFYNSKTVHKEDNGYKERESADYEESGEIFLKLVLLITHSSLQILAILCMIMIMLKEGVNKETSMSFMTKISSDLFLNPSLLLASDLIFVFVIVLILNYG